jgi:ubiquinone/menaquinone biosynthesis C-methylase UbiE
VNIRPLIILTDAKTMSLKSFLNSCSDYFKTNDVAATYDSYIGGVTRAISKNIVDSYVSGNTLERKIALDNACGTGVATEELLEHSKGIKIEAAVVEYL